MADVTDSKSVGSDTVWVRVPPPAPSKKGREMRPFLLFIFEFLKDMADICFECLPFYLPLSKKFRGFFY